MYLQRLTNERVQYIFVAKIRKVWSDFIYFRLCLRIVLILTGSFVHTLFAQQVWR
jgi:hypothetical protein